MAELAWQGLSKDGTKGGDGRPYVVGWDGDPERAMLTLGGWLSSLGAGVKPDFRVSRRLDLGWQEIPREPQTLMNRSGMLTSLPNEDKYTSHLCCTCLKLSWVGSTDPLPSSSPPLQSEDRSYFRTS